MLFWVLKALTWKVGKSPHPTPMCSIHLDDVTAPIVHQNAHHTPAYWWRGDRVMKPISVWGWLVMKPISVSGWLVMKPISVWGWLLNSVLSGILIFKYACMNITADVVWIFYTCMQCCDFMFVHVSHKIQCISVNFQSNIMDFCFVLKVFKSMWRVFSEKTAMFSDWIIITIELLVMMVRG